jgi:hypothetical protein
MTDGRQEDRMLIDCDDCAMQHSSACADCVVTFILEARPGPLEVDAAESEALINLASEGLLPGLRLVSRRDDLPPERAVGG